MIDLLNKIVAAGGDVVVVGGDLRVKAPKGLLTETERRLLAENKAAIINLLADAGSVVETPVIVAMQEPITITSMNELAVEPDLYLQANDQQAEPVEFTTPEGLPIRFAETNDEEEIVVPPPPCEKCGGFMCWWDFLGGVHCTDCERTAQVVGNKDPLRMVTVDSARVRQQAAQIRRNKIRA